MAPKQFRWWMLIPNVLVIILAAWLIDKTADFTIDQGDLRGDWKESCWVFFFYLPIVTVVGLSAFGFQLLTFHLIQSLFCQ